MPSSSDNTYASLVHKQIFDQGVQDELRDMTYYMDIADVRTENGEFIYARKGDDFAASVTTDDTYTTSNYSYDKDVVGLTKTAFAAENISHDERVKEGFMIEADRIDRHAEAIARKINRDTAVATLDGAGQLLDNEVLAGSASAGTPIALSSTNPDDVATTVWQLLGEANATGFTPYMAMRHKDAKQFGLFAMNSGNNVGDTTILGGFKYSNFFGMDIFVSNDVPFRVEGTATTNFSAGDTVTVAGVVFTFQAAPSAAGDVDLGGDVDTSLSNLATAINAGSGAGTTYVEVSSADRTTLKNVNVVAVAGSGTLQVTAAGQISGAETATGDFAWGTEAAHALAGARRSTVLRMPERGYYSDMVKVPAAGSQNGFLGDQLVTAQKFDNTVWTKTAPKIVDIKLAV